MQNKRLKLRKMYTQKKAAIHLSVCLALAATILFILNHAKQSQREIPPKVYTYDRPMDWNLAEELEPRQRLYYEQLEMTTK